MTLDKPSASEGRENLARAIWEKKPDCGGMGKSWPLDGKTPKEIRTIKHDMPAALELCFLYADTAIKFFQSAPAVWSSLPSGESDPLVRTDSAGADTRSPAVTVDQQMVDRALNAWFASPHSETDMGLERSMKAALEAALTDKRPPMQEEGK